MASANPYPSITEAAVDRAAPSDALQALPVAGRKRSSEWLLMIACFFLSWQLVRVPQYNFTLSDGAFALALGSLLLAGRINSAFLGRLTALWIVGVLCLLGGLFVGSIANDLTERWFVVASQYFIALLVLPVVLSSFDRSVLHQCGMAFVYGVALSQVLGILALQFVGYHALVPYVGRTIVLGNDRIGAMTAEPNANGAVCVYALLLLVVALMERRVSISAGLVLAGLLLAGLAFSASFTAIVALILISGALGLMTWSRGVWRIGVPVIAFALCYIGLGGPLPSVFVDRVAEAIVGLDLSQAGTFTSRTELIGEAWSRADSHFLVGLGVDQYRIASLHGAPVHNLPLLLLNEGGAIAFIGLLSLLLCLLAASVLIGDRDSLGGVICLCALIIVLIYTMSLPHMYARHWFGPALIIFATYLVSPVPRPIIDENAPLVGSAFPSRANARRGAET